MMWATLALTLLMVASFALGILVGGNQIHFPHTHRRQH